MDLIAKIAMGVPIARDRIESLIKTAPLRYKVYKIPKRSGKGSREIAQPAIEIKLLQRWAVQHLLHDLPIHPAATAYSKGSSIYLNAARHASQRYLLKLDFSDFFPSIAPSDLAKHLAKYSQLPPEEVKLLQLLLFRFDKRTGTLRLSIGAPSSPLVSNTLLFDFDSKASSICEECSVVYTRYADDLTFSTSKPHQLDQIEKAIQVILKSLDYPRLRLNALKTVHSSTKHMRRVTGLVLTPTAKISIGRTRKRALAARIHRFSLGQLPPDQIPSLKGELAFAWSVEKDFLERLRSKYGEEIMGKLGW